MAASTSTVTSALAIYAAVISTLSLILAVIAYKAGNPKVILGWEYIQSGRNLWLIVDNTGRADVTISSVDFYPMNRKVMSGRSRDEKHFSLRVKSTGQVSYKQWRPGDRLPSNSAVSVPVKDKSIDLTSGQPFDEIMLRAVVRYPGGRQVAYIHGEVLRHFLGIDPYL